MPIPGNRIESQSLSNRSVTPRNLDPALTYAFGDGTGTGLVLPVKTTTGDPTGVEGLVYANTFDNKIRVYADGVWRDLATW